MRIEKTLIKKVVITVSIIELIAAILGVNELLANRQFENNIKRPSKEGGIEYKTYSLETERGTQDISLQVSPIKRTDSEIHKLVEDAKAEIDNTILGENASLEEVTESLNLMNSYQDGRVNASWTFDNYKVIDSAGSLIYENIVDDTAVRVFCSLSIDDYEETYTFSILLKTPSVETDKGFNYLLTKMLIEKDKDNRDEEYIALPTMLNGVNLKWKPRQSNSGGALAAFGVLAGVLIVFASKAQEKKEKEENKKQLEIDYPDIVSMISLYIGAGVSFKGALDKISNDYKNRVIKGEKTRPGFEGILKLQRQINDGRGELESIKDFGKRMGHKDYRKLSIILVQNLKKGNAMLAQQLEKEEHQSFEDRKLRAKIAGEEASTKLLIPMMGLLSIVLVVLIFPAIIGISI